MHGVAKSYSQFYSNLISVLCVMALEDYTQKTKQVNLTHLGELTQFVVIQDA